MAKMKIRFLAGLLFLLARMPSADAFSHKAVSLGVGYHSQNVVNVVARNEKGESEFLGETYFPLLLKFDFNFAGKWFLAPQLSYTPLARTSAGDTAKTKITHLTFQLGRNVIESKNAKWDLYLGPGLILYQIQGAGGTLVMNNGTSTSTFAIPGGDSSVTKLTTNVGTSLAYHGSRLGLDLIVENAFSSKKRTQSLMLSYAYQFGGR